MTVTDPDTIAYHLERAWHLAQSGRPGPCWIDVPIDVQGSTIDEATLRHYDRSEDAAAIDLPKICSQVREVIDHLRSASRPVLLAGTGVRLAHALPEFEQVIRRLRIPVTTAWTHDLIDSDDELYCGRPGTIGQRAGNFTVQNSDLLLVLGSRLNVRQISYNYKSFARHAFKIQVDVDPAELDKPTVRPDLPIACDLKVFLGEMLAELDERGWTALRAHAEWLERARSWRIRYPAVSAKQRQAGPPLNSYDFIDQLFAHLAADDVVICGNATATIVPFQAARLKMGQRLISNSGSASMGHDLPAAIGAAIAREGERVICLAGDGSLQLNVQELQTIVHHQLPVKLFVLNNNGYLSIRTSQSGFFGRLVGESSASGVSFPDMVKLATAYGIGATAVRTYEDLPGMFEQLAQPGPYLFEIHLDPKQEFEPRIKSRQLPDGTIVSPALEDMYPFLSPEELEENMLAPEAVK